VAKAISLFFQAWLKYPNHKNDERILLMSSTLGRRLQEKERRRKKEHRGEEKTILDKYFLIINSIFASKMFASYPSRTHFSHTRAN
jgi:hypothetical protein